MKVLEENTKDYIESLGVGRAFLSITRNSEATKEKTKRFNYIQFQRTKA